MNSFIILQQCISMMINMVPHMIDNSHPNFNRIAEALRVAVPDWTAIEKMINIARSVKTFVGGRVEVDVENGVVVYKGQQLHGVLTNRILQMMREGFPCEPLINFLDNVMQNPSVRAQNELYGFLEYGKMPLTPDGCFLAYKRVNDNYTSVYDGKTRNNLGLTVSMPREQVNADPHQTCAAGLHFCSHEYLKMYPGLRVMVLKVNPRDVVAIPVDYHWTKGRACQYEIVGELSKEEVEKAVGYTIWTAAVVADYEPTDFVKDLNAGADRTDIDLQVDRGDLIIEAYKSGYTEGKGKGMQDHNWSDIPEVNASYAEGYKDGRGHKAKKYK